MKGEKEVERKEEREDLELERWAQSRRIRPRGSALPSPPPFPVAPLPHHALVLGGAAPVRVG